MLHHFYDSLIRKFPTLNCVWAAYALLLHCLLKTERANLQANAQLWLVTSKLKDVLGKTRRQKTASERHPGFAPIENEYCDCKYFRY